MNVRVIAATHRDLRTAITENKFREDLYYRLTMVEIRTPPLAERSGDLPLLVRHYIRHFARQFGKPVLGLTARAEIVLTRHHWPGNVRELENVIGHACMMAASERIDVRDLPDYLRSVNDPSAEAISSTDTNRETDALPSLDEQEKRLVLEALSQSNGNQSEAARILKIGRDALRYKMKKFAIESSTPQ